MPGRKPKPTDLHLVEGTLRAHHANRVEEPMPTGRPERPKFVKGRARKLWDKYFEIAYWLKSSDSHTLGLWCVLTVEITDDVRMANSSRIAQWRALGSELGFDPSSRARLSVRPDRQKTKDPAEKYFATNVS